MRQLVNSLGWSYGLPDDPVDGDYFQLLKGERSLRLEVENSHRPSDLLAVKHYTNYGPYSGSGWVSGTAADSRAHLQFLLPHSGNYQLAIASRSSGVKVLVAGKEFPVDGEDIFSRQELARLTLPAGQTEIVLVIPSSAAVDYIELQAPPLPRVEPIGGWRPEQPLSMDVMALTTLQALDLLQSLPLTDAVYPFEAERAAQPEGSLVTDDRYLGDVSGQGWLRAKNQTVQIPLSFAIPEAACYKFVIRGRGDEPAVVSLPPYFNETVTFGYALSDHILGDYCLPQARFDLKVTLPPWAGVDVLELREHDTSTAALVELLGLADAGESPDRQLINTLLGMVANLTF